MGLASSILPCLLPHRRLSLILVSLELAIGFCLAAAVVYTLCLNPEFFYCVLMYVLPEQTYSNLVSALGRIFPVVSERLLPS